MDDKCIIKTYEELEGYIVSVCYCAELENQENIQVIRLGGTTL